MTAVIPSAILFVVDKSHLVYSSGSLLHRHLDSYLNRIKASVHSSKALNPCHLHKMPSTIVLITGKNMRFLIGTLIIR